MAEEWQTSRQQIVVTCEDVLESQLDIAGIESGSLDEGKVVLA